MLNHAIEKKKMDKFFGSWGNFEVMEQVCRAHVNQIGNILKKLV